MRSILPRFSLSPVWKTKLIRRPPFRVCQRVNTSRSFLAMARRFINVVLLIVRPVNIGRMIAGTLATGDCSKVLCSFLSGSPTDSPSHEKNQFIYYTLQATSVLHSSESVPLCVLRSRHHSGIQGSDSFRTSICGGLFSFFRALSDQVFFSTLTHQ